MPRRRLFAKLVVATLVPVGLVMAGFGFFAYDLAQRTLEASLGQQLETRNLHRGFHFAGSDCGADGGT